VEAWRAIFYISAAIYTFGTVFYALFGSGELQSWAVAPQSGHDLQVELSANLVDDKKKKSAT